MSLGWYEICRHMLFIQEFARTCMTDALKDLFTSLRRPVLYISSVLKCCNILKSMSDGMSLMTLTSSILLGCQAAFPTNIMCVPNALSLLCHLNTSKEKALCRRLPSWPLGPKAARQYSPFELFWQCPACNLLNNGIKRSVCVQ